MSDPVKDWLRTRPTRFSIYLDLSFENELEAAARWFEELYTDYLHFLATSPTVESISLEEFQHRFSVGPWSPPIKGTHESHYDDRWGPLIFGEDGNPLPGTDVDETYDRAYEWSRS